MRTLKFLFCAACLCSVGVLAKTALTQEDRLQPAAPRETFRDPNLPAAASEIPAVVDEVDPFSDVGRVNRPALLRRGRVEGPFSEGIGYGGGAMAGGPIPAGPVRARIMRRTIAETVYEPIPPEELEAMKKLQAAIQELNTGKDEESRNAATDTIRQQLTTQFEADLKQREKELEEVEQRVKSLREQLDKRKAAQADIINLRLQTLVNNANGLGFPETNSGTSEVNLFTREYPLPPGSYPPLDPPGRRNSDGQFFEDSQLRENERKR